jgi:hypothetical protein
VLLDILILGGGSVNQASMQGSCKFPDAFGKPSQAIQWFTISVGCKDAP